MRNRKGSTRMRSMNCWRRLRKQGLEIPERKMAAEMIPMEKRQADR